MATKTAAAGKTHLISTVTVSSDKAGAILLIKQGSTTIWQAQVGAGVHTINFPVPLIGAAGALVSAEIDGTSACKANIAGATV